MHNLKLIRIKNGFSLSQMAQFLNISKTYYWQLENNSRRISYEMAIKISNIFKKKPDDIFYKEFVQKLGIEKE